ncbi:uncharacterized protein LOC141656379 [Silene latifolia]|uniref:uncharacterized protein LOC141656379 n=1 Tax=Silene latifolia TaxID=37657 RepID=UPI003D7862B5
MAEASPKQSETPPSNNPFVFLTQIPQCLLNSFKNLTKKQEKKAENDNKSLKNDVVVVVEESSVINAQKTPDVVNFPWIKQDVPPIKLESEDVQQDTNPIILWQVYALGGFIILKWAWGKWQERKDKAKEDAPDDDDHPAADDIDQPAADDADQPAADD